MINQDSNTSPTRPSSASIRPYRPDDEGAVLDLLSEAGGGWPPRVASDRAIDYLRWQLGDERAPGHVVAEANGRLVGCVLLGERRLNVGGQSYTSMEVVECAVLPEYRRRGVMRKLLAAALDGTGSRADVMVFQGGPRAARKLVDEAGGVKTRNMVEVLARPPLQGLRIATARPAESGFEIREVAAFDEGIDRLWAETSSQFQLAVERRSQYLNRRFCDPRAGTYRIQVALDGDAMVGYIVFCVAANKGYIADILALPQREDAVETLVRSALTEIDHTNALSSRCAIPAVHPYRQCLLDLGFVVRKRGIRLRAAPMQGRDIDWPRSPRAVIHWTLGDTLVI